VDSDKKSFVEVLEGLEVEDLCDIISVVVNVAYRKLAQEDVEEARSMLKSLSRWVGNTKAFEAKRVEHQYS